MHTKFKRNGQILTKNVWIHLPFLYSSYGPKGKVIKFQARAHIIYVLLFSTNLLLTFFLVTHN